VKFLGNAKAPKSLAFSGVRISCDPTRLHGRAQGRVVPFGLVGIGLGEVGYRAIEGLALAQVGGDPHAVAGAGVRPGQRPAAELSIEGRFVSSASRFPSRSGGSLTRSRIRSSRAPREAT
jgi:hypothetical protein